MELMSRFSRVSLAFTALIAAATPVVAQTNVSPNLSSGVGAFYTDRYAPGGFATANGIQGRNDVLQITIDQSTNVANRDNPFQASFYNTQGKKTNVNTSGSWFFSSDLYVDGAWADNSNGKYVRTDMWATATSDPAFTNVTAYPIIGVTNYGGSLRARAWNVNGGFWNDLGNTLNPDAWNTLAMGFDDMTKTFSYYVNGAFAASYANAASTGVANVMYQAYNFNDPAAPIMQTGTPNYTVNWSNTVPEPSTYALMAAGLAALGFVARRRKVIAADS